jgi:hypothetical protein
LALYKQESHTPQSYGSCCTQSIRMCSSGLLAEPRRLGAVGRQKMSSRRLARIRRKRGTTTRKRRRERSKPPRRLSRNALRGAVCSVAGTGLLNARGEGPFVTVTAAGAAREVNCSDAVVTYAGSQCTRAAEKKKCRSTGWARSSAQRCAASRSHRCWAEIRSSVAGDATAHALTANSAAQV